MEKNSRKDTTPQPWIEIEIGTDNQIIEFDEFVKEMELMGSVHIRKKWYPAFCTGLELGLVIKVGTWLANTLLAGIAYDLMKIGVKKLIDNLCKLLAANSEDLALQPLTIEYDDTSISFEGLSAGRLSGLAEFFNTLPNHLDWLLQHGVKNIDRISIPIYGAALELLDQKDKEALTAYDNFGSDYFRIWQISYDFGCNETFYDTARRILL